MKKKTDEPSTLKQVKELIENDRKDHKQETDAIIKKTYHAPETIQIIKDYDKKKKMKWWTYLIGFGLALVLTAIGVTLRYTTTLEIANYYNIVVTFGLIITMMSLNWWKNHQAAKYFNDKKRRYQRTLSDEEAKIFLINKTLFLILILFLPILISFAILL